MLARCLAKRPRDRYQTPSELVAVLRAVAASLPGFAPLPAWGAPRPAPPAAPDGALTGATLPLPGPLPGPLPWPAPGATPPAGPVEAGPGAGLSRTLDYAPALPVALSSFVGREREVAAVRPAARPRRFGRWRRGWSP